VTSATPADGKLHLNDQITSINGREVKNTTVPELSNWIAKQLELLIAIKRTDKVNSHTVTLERKNKSFGIHLEPTPSECPHYKLPLPLSFGLKEFSWPVGFVMRRFRHLRLLT
jgi:hypothetical protein